MFREERFINLLNLLRNIGKSFAKILLLNQTLCFKKDHNYDF